MDALANIVVIAHLAYFVFVAGGFVGIVMGAARRERWILNPWFRIVHFLAVLLVLWEDVWGMNCPLNTLEGTLRSPAPSAQAAEASSGLGYLLDLLLHHTISERMLDVMYWTMGLVSLLLLFLVPPQFRKHHRA
jgi:Protein of Unknown function (DUF2784)